MEFNFFNVDGERRADWERLCPLNEYRVVPPSGLPGPLPDRLTGKFESVLVMSSGTPGGPAVWMLNGNRAERPTARNPAGAVDQQPFAVAFAGDAPLGSGCLVQHGNWPGRTSTPPASYWSHVRESGVGHGFPLPELPSSASGDISDLPVASQHAAFSTVAGRLWAEFM